LAIIAHGDFRNSGLFGVRRALWHTRIFLSDFMLAVISYRRQCAGGGGGSKRSTLYMAIVFLVTHCQIFGTLQPPSMIREIGVPEN
jgi:hypothetical protein